MGSGEKKQKPRNVGRRIAFGAGLGIIFGAALGAAMTGMRPVVDMTISSFLYVAMSNASLRVYSLSSAENPTLIQSLALPVHHAERLSLDGENLVAAGDDGLLVINISNPTWPAIVGTHDFSGDTRDLAVRNELAIVGQMDQSRLIDYSETNNIQETAFLPDTGEGVLITSNNQVWLGWEACAAYGGMRIFDITDPAAPVWLHDEIDGFMGGPRTMVEHQGLVYATEHFGWCAGEWAGFHVFQLGTLPLMEPLASLEETGSAGMLRYGNRLDLATPDGLVSWDLSNPSVPQGIQVFDPDHGYYIPQEDAGLIVSVRWANGTPPYEFQVLTRNTDGNFELRGSIPLNYTPRDLALSGPLALISLAESHGAWALDVSNPDNPVILAHLFDGEDVGTMALYGDLAAISVDYSTGLYDLSEITDPILLSSLFPSWPNSPTYPSLVEQQGRLFLLASVREGGGSAYVGGLAQAIEVTDPTAPEILFSLRQLTRQTLGPVTLQGDLLVVPSVEHLSLYSWPSLDEPAEFVGRVSLPGDSPYYSITRAEIMGNCIAAQRWNDPITVWPLPVGSLSGINEDTPVAVNESPTMWAYPNPFNPTCEINFSLPAAGLVSVEVFDVQGRLVRTLLQANVNAGPHVLNWNGQDRNGQPVAAGVYLARVHGAEFSASVKLTLAK